MNRIVQRWWLGLGRRIRPAAAPPATDPLADLSPADKAIVARVASFTMTGEARTAALLNSVDQICAHAIPGNVAECGVWRGGSMMAVALALLARGDASRHLFLYDTFEGMSRPSVHDVDHAGEPAERQLDRDEFGTGVWCRAGLEDVEHNLLSTGYRRDRIHFIKGKVEDTIPAQLPGPLALLRLDTDWYESTRHELNHLFPLLDPRGILIVDDYGHWQGARKAVDEYFRETREPVFIHRIDYTGRVIVRTPRNPETAQRPPSP